MLVDNFEGAGPTLGTMTIPNVDPLLLCGRGTGRAHVDWYDQDECAVTLFDGVPVRHWATDAQHQSMWKCAVCADVHVRRPSPRADALDAVLRS